MARLPHSWSPGALPGIALITRYRREWVRGDLIAGVTLTALIVPQGIAYAALAGLPPVTGLYATLIPLLVYALVGPSRIFVVAPDSALTLVVAAAIVPLAGGDPGQRVVLAGMLALLVGAYALLAGLGRLGFLADLVSKPVRLGYLAGIAATVMVGQLPRLLGFSVSSRELSGEVRGLIAGIGGTRPLALGLGLATLATILLLHRLVPRAPALLIAVVGVTVAVAAFGLANDVATVGRVASGLPGLAWPGVSGAEFVRLAGAAVGIVLIAVADTVVLSRSYAARLGEPVDTNRELIALGLANAAAGLFHGFPVSGSATRTPVAEAAGARSQATGVVAASLLALVLAFATGLLRDLPLSALAAVLIVAVSRLVNVKELRRLSLMNPADFALMLACLVGVAAAGVLNGIAIAVGLSIAAFFWRAWHPHEATLGRVAGLKGYHDLERHPEARQVPGLVLLRFDAPLFFANAGLFRQQALRAAAAAQPPARRLVVAAEPITDVDSTAADMLVDLDRELLRLGVQLAFAELKDPVRDKLRRYGLLEVIGRERFYPTLGVAVHAFVSDFAVDWHEEVGSE